MCHSSPSALVSPSYYFMNPLWSDLAKLAIAAILAILAISVMLAILVD